MERAEDDQASSVTSSVLPLRRPLASLMQDRPVPHDQTHARLVSILAFPTHVHLSPILVLCDTFLHSSAGACSLFPQGSTAEGDVDQESEAVIKSRGARAEPLAVDSAILPLATRWWNRTIPLPESQGSGCGRIHWCISSASLCSTCL